MADHLSREAAEEIYGPGVTFQIGMVAMCTNTGTYLDVPFHRYADGHDLADLALERVAGRPAVLLDRRGREVIELSTADLEGCGGRAVIVRTDHSVEFTAAPPKIVGAGTFTVRAFATVLVGLPGPTGFRARSRSRSHRAPGTR